MWSIMTAPWRLVVLARRSRALNFVFLDGFFHVGPGDGHGHGALPRPCGRRRHLTHHLLALFADDWLTRRRRRRTGRPRSGAGSVRRHSSATPLLHGKRAIAG